MAASGQRAMPSLAAASFIHFGMSASGVASARPPLSRTASRLMKSPPATAKRLPLLPVPLFGAAAAHGFPAPNPVRLPQPRNIAPASLLLAFANDAAAIGDETLHQDGRGPGEATFLLVRHRGVLRHEHVRLH